MRKYHAVQIECMPQNPCFPNSYCKHQKWFSFFLTVQEAYNKLFLTRSLWNYDRISRLPQTMNQPQGLRGVILYTWEKNLVPTLFVNQGICICACACVRDDGFWSSWKNIIWPAYSLHDKFVCSCLPHPYLSTPVLSWPGGWTANHP